MICLGTGICEVKRVKRLLNKHGSRFLEFIFTDRESGYSLKRANPEIHLAGRFSAKMAVKKCLAGAGLRVALREVEVVPGEEGGVEICEHLKRKVREELSGSVLVNISHSNRRAVAIALLMPL